LPGRLENPPLALSVLNSADDMALPFLSRSVKKLDQVVAIDLGGRSSKAVHLQRKGDGYSLASFALVDAPIYERAYAPTVLSEHLKAVHKALGGTRTKSLALALGVGDAIFRQVELPLIPADEVRAMLKYNSKNYLQQELPDHVFDCYFVGPSANSKTADAKSAGGQPKQRAMVGAAKKQVVDDLLTAMKTAGFVGEQVVPGIIGPANSFELAEPEAFARETVALVDVGFKNTNIVILDCGEIRLNRVVAIGGDRLTSGLSDSMGISYLEAENIKVGMPTEVQQNLEPLIYPLGRELRASLDFFEHQEDKTVSQVYISGGSARSDFIIQALQAEMGVPCRSWNPAKSLRMDLDGQRAGEIELAAPQLTVAIGAALSALN
jgi:type IV pilus assembly protein PilM